MQDYTHNGNRGSLFNLEGEKKHDTFEFTECCFATQKGEKPSKCVLLDQVQNYIRGELALCIDCKIRKCTSRRQRGDSPVIAQHEG